MNILNTSIIYLWICSLYILLLRKNGKQSKSSELIIDIREIFIYINYLREDNGMIKVITSVKRSGKI